ncbi:MAG: DUF4230 domain-containing protein [Caldilineaceae bacterium]|nr:DUF4230 domain-containing protein [Caldilineaceae bacterium]
MRRNQSTQEQKRHPGVGAAQRSTLPEILSLHTPSGRIGVLVVAIALALIVTPFVLPQFSPSASPSGSTESRESASGNTLWPTPPATYVAPVAPPPVALRAQPTPPPLPRPEWHEMSHLTVIEFMQSSVVDIQRTAEVALLGDVVTDRLLLKATGEIQMGLDLSQVRDVEINGTAIRFTAPQPEIISVELLPERSQIFERRQTLFLSNYTGLETEALEMARRQLRAEVAATPSMMTLAEEYSRLQLSEFLHKLGYTTVEITFVEGGFIP